jgi:hypothetical protein
MCLLLLPNVWEQSEMSKTKVYTSLKNLKQDKAMFIPALQKVVPKNNMHFSKEVNESYFFIKNQPHSIYKISTQYVAIIHDDTLYLNMDRLRLGEGFAKILTQGKYWVVQAANIIYHSDEQERTDLIYESSSGTYKPTDHNGLSRKYMYYAIDSKTFDKIPLTFAGMIKILSFNEPLQIQFVKDKYNDDPYVMMQYVQEINRYINYFDK